MQDNQLIRAGQWWRLITPVALHANLLHLVTNNYSLNSLGPAVEMLSGRPRFLSVYAASAVAGSAASFAFSPAASVGASGQLPIEGLVVTQLWVIVSHAMLRQLCACEAPLQDVKCWEVMTSQHVSLIVFMTGTLT